jgi:flagellar protein FliS
MEQYYEEFDSESIELSKMKNISEIILNNESRVKIIVMLYDGCIGYIQSSIEYMNDGDIVKSNIYVEKAKKIISELEKSLKHFENNKISEDLKILYSFLNNHLSKAATNNDLDAFTDVVNMLSTLRESWNHVSDSILNTRH